MTQYSDSTGGEARPSNSSTPSLTLYKMSHCYTGKCIRRFGGINAYCRYFHSPEVVDIGVNRPTL